MAFSIRRQRRGRKPTKKKAVAFARSWGARIKERSDIKWECSREHPTQSDAHACLDQRRRSAEHTA